MNDFTLNNYNKIFKKALDEEYRIITLKEFFCDDYNKNHYILVNRIDVDI